MISKQIEGVYSWYPELRLIFYF